MAGRLGRHNRQNCSQTANLAPTKWVPACTRWWGCRVPDDVGPEKRKMTEEKITMKAIVVTDQGGGTAGMKLVEGPEPQAAINDVVVQVHASGFTSGELTWPSTWTDRLGRDR